MTTVLKSERYKALQRFFDRHLRERCRQSYPTKGKIFGITLGPQWRAVCEKFLR